MSNILKKILPRALQATGSPTDLESTWAQQEALPPSVAADQLLTETCVGPYELCGNQIYGAFVLNRRVDLHAIDATPDTLVDSTQVRGAAQIGRWRVFDGRGV